MGIEDRIREVINARNMTIKGFAEEMDTPLRTLHNYLSGEREPSAEFLIKLSQSFNINLNWLLLNKGEIYLSESKSISLTVEEAELLNQYRSVNKSGKRILEQTSQIIFDELK
ncbi:helix-turn-helix domain-containing protein [Pasteurella multocida]